MLSNVTPYFESLKFFCGVAERPHLLQEKCVASIAILSPSFLRLFFYHEFDNEQGKSAEHDQGRHNENNRALAPPFVYFPDVLYPVGIWRRGCERLLILGGQRHRKLSMMPAQQFSHIAVALSRRQLH